jgi:hypothetical protein
MGQDEEEDCKTWQKSSGNTTLLRRELWWGLQKFQLLRKRKYGLHYKRRTALKGANTYICTCVCVCVFCVQCDPIFTRAKSTFYKKNAQAEIELLSDHISYYSFHVLCLQSFIYTSIHQQQSYAVCYK